MWHWFSVGEYKYVMLSCKYRKTDDCRQFLIPVCFLNVSSKFCAANAPELKSCELNVNTEIQSRLSYIF